MLAGVHGARTRAASSCTTSASSAAAAARRPSTSGRSRRPCAAGDAGRRDAPAPAAARVGRRRSRRPIVRAAGAARAEVAPRARAGARRASSSASSCCRRAASRREPAIQRARELKRYGVDVINIPDGLRAGARLSALSLAVLIEQQAGIETLLHYSCRDRNLLGIQSDLLGAHAMGLRNLLLITGDPGRVGDYPDATAVFDVDSIGLTNVVSRLNHGCDVGGQAIGAPTAFHIGVSVNPAASNLDEELRRFDYKVEAGAEFVLTRPIFDLAAFERVPEADRVGAAADHCRRSSRSTARATPSSWPTRCPGVRVPEALMDRMRRADGQDAAAAEGIAIAREIAAALRHAVQGIQVSTPVGQYRRGAGRARWTSLSVRMYSRSSSLRGTA